MRTFHIILVLGICLHTNAQSLIASDVYTYQYNIDSLRKIYGNHKKFLKNFEAASLVALSYYPELVNEHIRFEYKSINSTARTSVTLFSMLDKEKKQYVICINNDIKRTGMLLDHIPFPGQVALIAHELGHVIDFQKRGALSMAAWGIRYLVAKHRIRVEKKTDLVVIQRGLGEELYFWADYVLNHSTANKHYLKIKKSKYLLPEEILAVMKKYKY